MDKKFIDISYEIEFFSNWHCGSGQAAGADVDALVIKDKDGLPFVPGRTIKGLLREAAKALSDSTKDPALIDCIFGISGDADKETQETRLGCAFFSNAVLKGGQAIAAQKLAPYLYQSFSSTAIDENGIAKDNSLRKTETVVPCTLQGKIMNVPSEGVSLLQKAMSYIKRMGTGRNRGFGRCEFTVRTKEDRQCKPTKEDRQ